MSLYPSLEDMKVHQLSKVQVDVMSHVHMNQYMAREPGAVTFPNAATEPSVNVMYPSLGEFMGLELSEAAIAANMPEYSQAVIPAQPVIPSAMCRHDSNVFEVFAEPSGAVSRCEQTIGGSAVRTEPRFAEGASDPRNS